MQRVTSQRRRRLFIGIVEVEKINENKRFWQRSIVSRHLNLGHFWNLISAQVQASAVAAQPRPLPRDVVQNKSNLVIAAASDSDFSPYAAHSFQCQHMAGKLN